MRRRTGAIARWGGVLAVIAGWWGVGCAPSPLSARSEAELRRAVVESVRRELAEPREHPGPRTLSREGGIERVGIKPELMAELEGMAGPGADRGATPTLREDLLGRPARTVSVSLERAVRSAAENNLAVQFARLSPRVSESAVVSAEAAFDWALFSNLTWNSTDDPRVRSIVGSTPFGTGADVQQLVASQTGLRRNTIGGGRFTIQHEINYLDNRTPGVFNVPDPSSQLTVTMQYDQPLLRGFGSESAMAEVRLARNASRNTIASLKRDLLRTASEVEQTYWRLVQARREVLIFERLLARGIATRDQIEQRSVVDALPAQIAASKARVEQRVGQLMRAQSNLRQVSDRLKALMNDPELPVGSEVLVMPADEAVDAPITFSLVDALLSGVSNRPEVQEALLSIDDTSIRQMVADNARLPQLDLRVQARTSVLRDRAGTAYGDIADGEFVSYLVGLVFEYPLGNRRAMADYARRRVERMQATIAYRKVVQDIIVEVKGALDTVSLNYRLIGQTAAARLAAAEELRALGVEKELKPGGYTVERLNLELNRQEALAQAERDEVQAIVEYNASIAALYAAMGTGLERNRIRFDVPRSDEDRRDGR